jgi:hypothetical protein
MNETTNNLYDPNEIKDLKKEAAAERRNGLIGGIFLILLGGLFLATQFLTFDIEGWFFLPLLATIFIIWGVLTRNGGLLIPGGILSGISLGIFLMDMPFVAQMGMEEGGVFLLGFAFGWVLIALLSALFTSEIYWWALIPAGIMGIIGLGIVTDGILLDLIAFIGRAWPLALIAVGLYIILRPHKVKEWLDDDDSEALKGEK